MTKKEYLKQFENIYPIKEYITCIKDCKMYDGKKSTIAGKKYLIVRWSTKYNFFEILDEQFEYHIFNIFGSENKFFNPNEILRKYKLKNI